MYTYFSCTPTHPQPKTNSESAAPPSTAGYVGYIGPFPRVKTAVMAASTDKAASAPRSVSSSVFYGVTCVSLIFYGVMYVSFCTH